MKINRIAIFVALTCLLGAWRVSAGPFPPAAGEPGSTAVHLEDPELVAWATGYQDYIPGAGVSITFQTPERALGMAGTDPTSDLVSLGEGGVIVLTFGFPVRNGEEWDFAVFENAFDDRFLELAYVEVSSDGTNFFRFPNNSLTIDPIGAFGTLDTTDIDGLAGKYRQSFGTPFDLEALSGTDGLNINAVTHIRIVDIIGNGSFKDSNGNPIYDPYQTSGSAGFDLDAVGVRYLAQPAAVRVDVQANGTDGPLTVSPGSPVSLSLSLDPGNVSGQAADYWFGIVTGFEAPLDWLVYSGVDGWQHALKPLAQAPLVVFTSLELFVLPLPAGDYLFFFAVDANADGTLDATWLDAVTVHVRQ